MDSKKNNIDVEHETFEVLTHSFDVHTIELARKILEEAQFVLEQEEMAITINNKIDALYRREKEK